MAKKEEPKYCPIYERKRNLLIPFAEKTANEIHGKRKPNMTEKQLEAWYTAWNRTFHDTMNILAKARGLT
jgi:hypothetical protein